MRNRIKTVKIAGVHQPIVDTKIWGFPSQKYIRVVTENPEHAERQVRKKQAYISKLVQSTIYKDAEDFSISERRLLFAVLGSKYKTIMKIV